MNIYQITKEFQTNKQYSIALGNFDGMHLGHQKLIQSIQKDPGNSILLFDHHTKETIYKHSFSILTTLQDKLDLLKQLKVDTVFVLSFDENTSKMSPRDFLQMLKTKLNVYRITVGADYCFGNHRSGTIDTLKEYIKIFQYDLHIFKEFSIDGESVRSTRIRDFLSQGNITQANKFLGRYYQIRGTVIHGEKRGRTLNFPTINLSDEYHYFLPKDGVYLTKTVIEEKQYISITSIGMNLTFDEYQKKVETYVLDFNRMIYGEKVAVVFLEYMRENVKFKNRNELVQQLNKDKKYAILKKKIYF